MKKSMKQTNMRTADTQMARQHDGENLGDRSQKPSDGAEGGEERPGLTDADAVEEDPADEDHDEVGQIVEAEEQAVLGARDVDALHDEVGDRAEDVIGVIDAENDN